MTNGVTTGIIGGILSGDGLPFRDLLSRKFGGLINKKAPEHRERIYPPETAFFGMVYEALDSNSSLRGC